MENINHKKNPKDKGFVVWLTGLPCSGKTTMSKKIEEYFNRKGISIYRMDGDIFRNKQTQKLNFSKKDRDKNVKLAAQEANRRTRKGDNVVAAFVSPYRKTREYIRKTSPKFYEVYIKCDIKECIKRDSKGMYKKALKGEIQDFTGIQDPYEEPMNPSLILETDKYSKFENVKKLEKFLSEITGNL